MKLWLLFILLFLDLLFPSVLLDCTHRCDHAFL
jgi:hypothetical protein